TDRRSDLVRCPAAATGADPGTVLPVRGSHFAALIYNEGVRTDAPSGRLHMDATPTSTSSPAVPTPIPPPPVVAAWSRSAQLTTAFLFGVVVTLLAVHAWGLLRWGTRPAELSRQGGLTYRIDLNQAPRAELLQIPGVGESRAERIERYRREY